MWVEMMLVTKCVNAVFCKVIKAGDVLRNKWNFIVGRYVRIYRF